MNTLDIDPRLLGWLQKLNLSHLPRILAQTVTSLEGDLFELRDILQQITREKVHTRLQGVEDLGSLIDIDIPGPFDDAIKKQIGEYLRPKIPEIAAQLVGEEFTSTFLTPS